jgi:hypothetical protein
VYAQRIERYQAGSAIPRNILEIGHFLAEETTQKRPGKAFRA